jgi:hypothetical protein
MTRIVILETIPSPALPSPAQDWSWCRMSVRVQNRNLLEQDPSATYSSPSHGSRPIPDGDTNACVYRLTDGEVRCEFPLNRHRSSKRRP